MKASIEADEAQKQAENEAEFEPEMSDYLTKPDDTAWLNQLAVENDDASEPVLSDLDWMADVSSDPDLDWLDSGEDEDGNPEESAVEQVEDGYLDEEDSQDTPDNLDDAMSWLEDLAAEQEKPIEPLPTVAEVLDDDDDLDLFNALL